MENGSNDSFVLCEIVNAETVSCDGEEFSTFEGGEGIIEPGNAYFWMYLVVYLLLVLFAGMCSYLLSGYQCPAPRWEERACNGGVDGKM